MEFTVTERAQIAREDILSVQFHELKNSLAQLSINLDSIPRQGCADHDAPLDAVRLLCGQLGDRLHQTLLLYRGGEHGVPVNVDAYCPAELLDELTATAESLAASRVAVVSCVVGEVPAIWFFDRNLVGMAMLNAIHNSLAYARGQIAISMGMREGCLELTVRDDSPGYPEHVLNARGGEILGRTGGTGLGLHFAAMIAKAHVNRGRYGRTELSNQDGARFSLLLP